MSTQLDPIDHDERPSKRARIGGQGSGFGEGDDEFASIMSGNVDGSLRPHGFRMDMRGAASDQQQTDEAVGVHVQDLAVANEQGEAIGSYVPPKHLTVEQAYESYINPHARPVRDFDNQLYSYIRDVFAQVGLGQNPASSGQGCGDVDDSVCEDDDPAKMALSRFRKSRKAQALSSSSSSAPGMRKRSRTINPQEIERREIDRLCELGGVNDREHLLECFADNMRESGISEECLFTRMCPLCAFMDNTQDAVGNQEFTMIDKFADEGVGNIDADTHAMLLAFLWNKRIYLPMRRRNLRVLPLTARMAKDHVAGNHRFNKKAEMLKDCKKLSGIHELLFQTAFKENGMTGELSFDKERILVGIKVLESKYKILNMKDDKDPFRTAHRVTAASAGTQTNPMQAVRRSIRK